MIARIEDCIRGILAAHEATIVFLLLYVQFLQDLRHVLVVLILGNLSWASLANATTSGIQVRIANVHRFNTIMLSLR